MLEKLVNLARKFLSGFEDFKEVLDCRNSISHGTSIEKALREIF